MKFVMIMWLIAVFIFGALFDRYAMPHIFSEELGVVIHSGSERGSCSGTFGSTSIRFGVRTAVSDGTYTYLCGDGERISDSVVLMCQCP